MKKLITTILGLTLLASTASAQMGGGISYPNYWKKVASNVVFINALYELGSLTQPIAKLWVNDIATSGDVVLGGTLTYDGHQTQYVATTGSDVTGDGTAGNPYATVGKALSYVPYEVNEPYQILVANGSYTETFDSIKHVYSPSGQLTIDGYEDVVNVAGPFTVTGSTAFGTYSGTEIEVAAAGWGVDDYYADFIKFTTGSNAGTVYPIYSNDADSLITNGYLAAVNAGDEFYVVTPGVEMEMSNPIFIESNAPNTYYSSHFGISNASIDFTGSTSTVISGDGPILLPVVRFRKNSNNILEVKGGSINSSALYDSSGFTNAVYASGYQAGTAVQFNNTVPLAAADYVRLSNNSGINTGVNIGYFMVRNGVNMTARSNVVQFSTIDHATIDHASYGNLVYDYLSTKSTYTTPSIRIDDFSSSEIESTYFASCPVECIRSEDGIQTYVDDVSGATGTTYAIRVQDANDVLVGTNGVTLTGTSGDVLIDSTNEVLSWPASESSFTKTDAIYSSSSSVSSATPTINQIDTDTTDKVVGFSAFSNCTDTGSGTEDCDVTLQQQIAGSLTTFLFSDADGFLKLGAATQVVVQGTFGIVDGSNNLYGLLYPNADNGLILGLDTTDGRANNNFILATQSNLIKDHGLNTPSTNPTLWGFSGTDVDTNDQQRWSLTHDATDFIVDTDTGDIRFTSGWAAYRTSTAISANTAGETIIGVTDTSAPRTITLDTDNVKNGHVFIIKDESGAAGTNNITIDTEGAETIDGAASITITVNYGVARVYSDGTNWFTF